MQTQEQNHLPNHIYIITNALTLWIIYWSFLHYLPENLIHFHKFSCKTFFLKVFLTQFNSCSILHSINRFWCWFTQNGVFIVEAFLWLLQLNSACSLRLTQFPACTGRMPTDTAQAAEFGNRSTYMCIEIMPWIVVSQYCSDNIPRSRAGLLTGFWLVTV